LLLVQVKRQSNEVQCSLMTSAEQD